MTNVEIEFLDTCINTVKGSNVDFYKMGEIEKFERDIMKERKMQGVRLFVTRQGICPCVTWGYEGHWKYDEIHKVFNKPKCLFYENYLFYVEYANGIYSIDFENGAHYTFDRNKDMEVYKKVETLFSLVNEKYYQAKAGREQMEAARVKAERAQRMQKDMPLFKQPVR